MKQRHDRGDDRTRFLEVEFVGGPYDGHRQHSIMRPSDLATDLVWLVCDNVFRLLDGKDRRPGGSITSVALYELDIGGAGCRYRFVGSLAPEHLKHFMRDT